MATSLDQNNVQQLDTIVTNIIDGKRIENHLSQKLHELLALAVGKLDNSKGRNQHITFLERIERVKDVFNWEQIKAVLLSCKQNNICTIIKLICTHLPLR